MSKLTSRFIANGELWDALRDHVAKTQGVRAAVAYFGQNGAKLLPLKKGDTIIVDVSLGAVRQGVTDPRALKTLMQRGVAVSADRHYTRNSLSQVERLLRVQRMYPGIQGRFLTKLGLSRLTRQRCYEQPTSLRSCAPNQ
jgi:hypothetical protein